ncbi:MAG TPA: type II toxin-antitoxin system RatA family toxin [Burkholderiales bacterium]|nr:type II toxin-antitoxin system RatA family toxin [Burkholderiales bacterium]
MTEVKKTVLVAYPASRMFALVDTVEQYPEFLPWCGGTRLIHRDSQITRATIEINYHGVRHSFTTENTKREPELMEIRLVEGPFRRLDGTWRFHDLDGRGCKVEFYLHYEFSSHALELLLGPIFNHIADTFIDAFVKRARQVYGASGHA